MLPVVTVTIWEKEPFPTSSSEFASVPILKLQAGGRQFSPRDKFEYRTELVIKTKKQLAGLSLTYLGNFPDVPMPEDEIIFTEAGVMLMILPEKIDYKLAIYYRNNQKFTSGTFVNPEPPWWFSLNISLPFPKTPIYTMLTIEYKSFIVYLVELRKTPKILRIGDYNVHG